ncbi:hypothetical protein KPL40_15850 [Clostridium gasigenes]|uniref:hypothetical protein n=1 Tax=Clostridium gasigenes TaxID=94869 RepID=UPI001C0AC8D5|nr:hypothetical protein [Clostridium gasigenes]MBU3133903.1 hypothetical protein [Clostridium gasigenes]
MDKKVELIQLHQQMVIIIIVQIQVINVGSVIYNFGLGMFDAAKGTVEGICSMLANPIDTIKNLGEAAFQLTIMAKMQGTSVEVVVLKQIIAAVSEMISDFDNGTLNKKARIIGRLVGEILLCVIGNKGFKYTIEGIQTVAKNSKFTNPPYTPGKTVLEFELEETTTFVTVYEDVSSFQKGGWIMKKEDIVGLTKEQIRDKYDLPTMPNI